MFVVFAFSVPLSPIHSGPALAYNFIHAFVLDCKSEYRIKVLLADFQEAVVLCHKVDSLPLCYALPLITSPSCKPWKSFPVFNTIEIRYANCINYYVLARLRRRIASVPSRRSTSVWSQAERQFYFCWPRTSFGEPWKSQREEVAQMATSSSLLTS